MTLLYIDDDADDGELVQEAVASIDPSIEVIVFHEPQKALEYLDQNRPVPDYVFIDVNMPKYSGGECLQWIKQQPALSAVPVVMCSTSFQTSEMKEFFRLGAADYIVKPPSLRKLVEAFSSILLSPMKRDNKDRRH